MRILLALYTGPEQYFVRARGILPLGLIRQSRLHCPPIRDGVRRIISTLVGRTWKSCSAAR